nr:AAA family ATPase [Alphaproteobacteria bacterium]
MTDTQKEIKDWLEGQRRWLQVAARMLFAKTDLTDSDILELTELCHKEANGEGVEVPSTTSVPDGSSPTTHKSGQLRLVSISNVQNVNALSSTEEVKLDGDITVFYGQNGSGKSSYVRLLKHICGSRYPGKLLGNIYKEMESGSTQEATVTYTSGDNNEEQRYEWEKDACPDLSDVDIFDTATGDAFVRDHAAVRYEPSELAFFSRLVDVCDKVKERLEAKKSRVPVSKPSMPTDMPYTREKRWYDKIAWDTTREEVLDYCTDTAEHQAEREQLKQVLQQNDPDAEKKKVEKKKEGLEALIKVANAAEEQLSNDQLEGIANARKEVADLEKVAASESQALFSGLPLDGVGTAAWQQLWRAAQAYSTTEAYKEMPFPHTGDDARCVLCHQSLAHEAKERMRRFEDFVKGQIRS